MRTHEREIAPVGSDVGDHHARTRRRRASWVSCGSYRPVKQTSREMESWRLQTKLEPPRSGGRRARKGLPANRAIAFARWYRPNGNVWIADAETETQKGAALRIFARDHQYVVGQRLRKHLRERLRIVCAGQRNAAGARESERDSDSPQSPAMRTRSTGSSDVRWMG